jgi:hypothetical protein
MVRRGQEGYHAGRGEVGGGGGEEEEEKRNRYATGLA